MSSILLIQNKLESLGKLQIKPTPALQLIIYIFYTVLYCNYIPTLPYSLFSESYS